MQTSWLKENTFLFVKEQWDKRKSRLILHADFIQDEQVNSIVVLYQERYSPIRL